MVKTQGREGEIAAELHSDVPDRFIAGIKVFALPAHGARRELKIEEVWPHQGRVVLKFKGVETISEAEVLVGCELQVPVEERAKLEPGWTYISDLVGCRCFDSGREVGKIEDVRFGAGEAPLLIVKAKGNQEYEIPFAQAYLEKLDIEAGQVRMKLPEGMLEVNAPLTDEEKREQQKRSS